MRIISQNGKIDFPYAELCISITADNKIVATKGVCDIPEIISKSVIAIYSTEKKALKAMEMLHIYYQYTNECKILGTGSSQPQYTFRFPQDDEIEPEV